MYYGDKWDPTNDHSYDGLTIYKEDDAFFGTGNEVRTDNICVYIDGKHVGGIEPDGSGPETEDPTDPTTSSGSASSGDVNWGDSNCDGLVDLADAVLIMQYSANPDEYGLGKDKGISEQGAENADVTGGGDGITNLDALTIQKYKLGLIDSLPQI